MPAKRIRQIRLIQNLTQEYVAFEINISQSQLSKYENGDSVPNVFILTELARVLNVEVFEFFYNSERELDSAIRRWQNRTN